ncbi:unnamed protein product [Peniophora sp. CBMAI 1063]|nr:unnamed protein product [Peniophora sp. CBMAI 1063]
MDSAVQKSNWFPDVARRVVELTASILPRDVDFQSELQRETLFLEHAITQLKRVQNAQRPLVRLPPEVLVMITEILTDEWPAFGPAHHRIVDSDSDSEEEERITARNDTSSDKRQYLGWILFGHVCSSLRNTLLGRPVFWAKVVSKNLRARETILQRCGETPLHLIANTGYNATRYQSELDFISKHMPRAHTIDVELIASSAVNNVFSPAILAQRAMPHLVKLRVRSRSDETSILIARDTLDLPAFEAPHLRDLSFENVMVPFPTSNLVHLQITFSSRYAGHLPSEYIADLTEHLNALETLSLGRCLSIMTPAHPAKQPRLPRLSFVTLKDQAAPAKSVWVYLRALRPSACFTIDITFNPARDRHGDAVPISLQGSIDADVAGLCIFTHGDPPLEPAYWDEEPPESGDDRDDEYHISFFAPRNGAVLHDYRAKRGEDVFRTNFDRRLEVIFDCLEDELPCDVVNGLAPSLDFGAITTLSLSIDGLNDPKEWSRTLRPFVNVETLVLKRGYKAIVLALTPSFGETGINPLLPRLRFLWISRLTFRAAQTAQSDGITAYASMLEWRTQDGAALQHLRVDALHMDKSLAKEVFVPRMESLVPRVECTIAIKHPRRGPVTAAASLSLAQALFQSDSSESSSSESNSSELDSSESGSSSSESDSE